MKQAGFDFLIRVSIHQHYVQSAVNRNRFRINLASINVDI